MSFSFATGILKIMWEVRYEYIKKNGWQVECKPELLCGAMSVTIGFINEKGRDDETQLDILPYDERDLSSLFSEFCKENGFPEDTVTYIPIVQMAEGMEALV